MKIVYDHQIYIWQEYGGISRYFYELSKALLKDPTLDVKNTVRLSNNEYTSDRLYNTHSFFTNQSFPGKFRILRIVNEWSSKKELNKGFDIFHPTYYDTYFFSTIKNKPFVITFYDLIHERFSNKFKNLGVDKDLFTRRKLLLEKATRVIAISQSTKNDIVDIYKIPEAKIDVVYLANSIDSKDSSTAIPYKNYILYVVRSNSYKNFTPFIKAITPLLIKEKDLKVVCAGGGRFDSTEQNLFTELKISDQMIQTGINDQLLAALYKSALFFVFPSNYEGFGIPVLEAFSCSCPALISDVSSLPEVGGNAALYFDPNDKSDILDKVSILLYDSDLRKKLAIAGLEREKLFSWSQTAIRHKEIYNLSL